MVLVKIGLPTMRGSLVMTTVMISPSRREVSPAESLRRRAKVLLPKFLKSSLLLFYFKIPYIPENGGQKWARASTRYQGAPGRWLALVPRGHWVAPL